NAGRSQGGEQQRGGAAAGGEEPYQNAQRERRKRDQRPSSRVDDRARIGVENPAAHLDRGHEQRKRKRGIRHDRQVHCTLSSRAINTFTRRFSVALGAAKSLSPSTLSGINTRSPMPGPRPSSPRRSARRRRHRGSQTAASQPARLP